MPERYSNMDEMTGFGFVANAFSGGGDRGSIFPASDAEDMSRGARFIPGNVTLARRAGQTVSFITQCTSCCWYWQMSDGSRIFHFERFTYNQIGPHNLGTSWDEAKLSGSCPHCSNPFTRGGTVTPEEIANGAYREDQGS